MQRAVNMLALGMQYNKTLRLD